MVGDFDRVAELRDHALLFALPSSAAHARHYLEPARRLGFDERLGERRPAVDRPARRPATAAASELAGARAAT